MYREGENKGGRKSEGGRERETIYIFLVVVSRLELVCPSDIGSELCELVHYLENNSLYIFISGFTSNYD